ncbi:MAG TPA: PEGA domain-containing protein [Polyangiales bacterium]|nr:PEGA domain-containing protein [Polyangiales bacterium]
MKAAPARLLGVALAASLPLVAASPSRAQPAPAPDEATITAQAREHFQRGTMYYGEGDYRAALIEFERAYELRHTYRLLYNLAQTAYELRDYAAAERHFRAYLVEGEDEITPERRAEVENDLAQLRERVASLDIHSTPPGAQVHVDDRFVGTTPLPGPVRVSAGRRRVLAELAGRPSVHRTVDVAGGETLRVELPFGAPLMAAAPDSARGGSANVAPWITGIAAGVFALTAAGVGYSAYHDAKAYDDQLQRFTTRDKLDDLAQQSRNKALAADVLLGAAVISLSITAVLLLVPQHAEEPRPASARALAPSGF